MELYGEGRQRAERMIIFCRGRLQSILFSSILSDSTIFSGLHFHILYVTNALYFPMKCFTWNKLDPPPKPPSKTGARPHDCFLHEGGRRQERQQYTCNTHWQKHTFKQKHTHADTHTHARVHTCTHTVHLSLSPSHCHHGGSVCTTMCGASNTHAQFIGCNFS